MLLGILHDLQAAGCVELTEDNKVRPTRLGEIASFYYIQYHTVKLFADSVRAVDSIPALLQLVSSASEYDVEPVRHNEDQLLETFSASIHWQVPEGSDFNDPHLKVFMLLQGFMQRLPLPITDFVNDQNSVMDNSIRLINALADIPDRKRCQDLLVCLNLI